MRTRTLTETGLYDQRNSYAGTVSPDTGYISWRHSSIGLAQAPQRYYVSRLTDCAGKAWKYQDCLHWKRVSRYGIMDANGQRDQSLLYATSRPLLTGASVKDIGRCLRSIPGYHGVAPDKTESLYNRFFTQGFLPQDTFIERDPFNSGFNVWMFVTDLYTLGGTFAGLANSLRSATSAISRDSLPLKDLADGHLGVQFGILPTFDDISKFADLLIEISELDALCARIQKKKERQRLTIEKSVVKTLPICFPDYSKVLRLDLPLSVLYPRVEVKTAQAEYHRTVRYEFTAPEFRGWIARLRQLVDRFGVLDPAYIWDAIPFSFIADWFVSVGSWLQANRPRFYPFDIRILDYCESIKVVQDVNWYLDYDAMVFDGRGFETRTNALIANEQVTNYVRKRFAPPPVRRVRQLPKKRDGGWTFRRCSIAAALLAQRLVRNSSREQFL